MEIIDKKSGLIIENYINKTNVDISKLEENQNLKYFINKTFGKMEFEISVIDINLEYPSSYDEFESFDDIDFALSYVTEILAEFKRMNIILMEQSKIDDEQLVDMEIDLSEDTIQYLEQRAKQFGISSNELVVISIIEFILSEERKQFNSKFESILDIYQIFDNPELLVEQSKDTIVLQPNGKHFIIVPKQSEFFEVLEME